nr:SiaB family protein kinase [uncultured Desulfuromonas sp.]
MQFEKLENILDDEGIVFLSYGGAMTQPLISGMTDALEKEVESNDVSMKISNNIFTIFIELSQNMMNYAKAHPDISDVGLIIVGMTPDKSSYYIISRNKVGEAAKKIIEEHLAAVKGLDKDELRMLYRERRKSKKRDDTQGASIGFIEIARRCDKIEHNYQPQKNDTYYFTVKAIIHK